MPGGIVPGRRGDGSPTDVRGYSGFQASASLAGELGATNVTTPARPDRPGGEARAVHGSARTTRSCEAALESFAAQGYDAMSLRSLNAQLGLSHGTISQRFGTKERLYFAAVDLGFTSFLGRPRRASTGGPRPRSTPLTTWPTCGRPSGPSSVPH